jgi:signal transduction histidine kinase
MELLIRRDDGSQLPIRASTAILKNAEGAQQGVVTVFEDITAIKEFERIREEWTSVVAHELRQAIGVISLSAQLALEIEKDEHSREMVVRELERIRRSTKRLTRMVDDLIDVSRIEARRLELTHQEVDLPGLVGETVDRLEHFVHEGGVRVEQRNIPGPVWADAGRIEQVLGNLFSNAVKYGDPTAEILIELTGRQTEVQVTVSNRGPGIPPDELPQLFNRFARAQQARRAKVPGLGLGLYICKGIIEAHGGRIWAESTPSGPTRFHFTLPLAPERKGPR